MAEDESATLIFRERKNFGERYAEVRAWDVPESDHYPDGVKYSLQYGTLDGETLIRYNNFPDHPGAAAHHKHTRVGSVEDINYDGIRDLYQQFKKEVNDHGHDWN
jgi:hypothetical protein